MTRHQRSFTQFTHPAFPSRVAPGWNGSPRAFPRASHPADQEPDDARRGGDRPLSTGLEQHLRHQPNLQSCVFTRGVRPRVARLQAAAHRAGPGWCSSWARACRTAIPSERGQGSCSEPAQRGCSATSFAPRVNARPWGLPAKTDEATFRCRHHHWQIIEVLGVGRRQAVEHAGEHLVLADECWIVRIFVYEHHLQQPLAMS